MEKAEVADFHAAVRQDMLEEPTEKLSDLKVRGAEACTAHFTVGKGDGAVREADETLVRDGGGDWPDCGRSKGWSRPAGRCAPAVRPDACFL